MVLAIKKGLKELSDEQLRELLLSDWVENVLPYYQDVLRKELARAGVATKNVKFYTPKRPSLGFKDIYGFVFSLDGSIVIMYDPNSTYTPWTDSKSRIGREIRHEVAHIANGDLDYRSGLVGFIKKISSEPRAVYYANLGYRFKPA